MAYERSLLTSRRPVTLVGGGDLTEQDLSDARRFGPDLVAADGGADAALALGHTPRMVVGDLDSISQDALDQMPDDDVHYIAEQESTDFDKALRSIRAPVVLAVGFLGGRVDHQLAVLNALTRHHDRACILVGATELIFAIPQDFEMDMNAGDPVSLFPMNRVSGRSTGLEWPIDGLVLAPDGRVGTSNRALGPISLHLDRPGLLGFVPRSAFQRLIDAL